MANEDQKTVTVEMAFIRSVLSMRTAQKLFGIKHGALMRVDAKRLEKEVDIYLDFYQKEMLRLKPPPEPVQDALL